MRTRSSRAEITATKTTKIAWTVSLANRKAAGLRIDGHACAKRQSKAKK